MHSLHMYGRSSIYTSLFYNIHPVLIKELMFSDDLFTQGSEIFTVVAKDGDVGNPNPIHYSFDDGKQVIQEKKLESLFH